MTNFDVCVAFVNGSKNGAHSLSMSINHDGSKLYSYATVIAQKLPNGAIILNDTKYSVTTNKQTPITHPFGNQSLRKGTKNLPHGQICSNGRIRPYSIL